MALTIGFLKRMWLEQRAVAVRFQTADKKNQIYRMEENGISIVLPMSDAHYGKSAAEYSRYAARFVGREIKVYITSVDEELKAVTCSYHEYVRKNNENNRNRITEDFNNGKEVIVSAKITGIHGEGARSFALLRFNESGLRGYVDCRDWSTGYTSDIHLAAKPGDTVKVKVVEKNKSSLKTDFRCSRAAALDDPWKGIGEKLHRKDVVNVKICGKWNGGFSGMIEGFPDITPWVALPDKHEFRLVPGLIYQCEITSLYEESKSMRVRPLRLCFFD